ncbi:Fe-S cluster assembly ATPase SufC [Rhodomicrobium lacus]|uniref:Fe-S cluster assembly ATPase SufC n=1 Tax=Rhodomicrobium lacus TaxID=2498452 RepID=UPI0026E427BB|nr:Fe-S cluster assembly ATPase SufC [Rhodomicrobium lacus]WKW50005.1 Fe-S cluster assembly ATPase SufC [Rhodomicrobium lacus]
MLEIKDLRAEVDGKEILKGFSLTVPKGEVHAIMGPNGSGKSTLSYVLSGKEGYEVTGGSATWNGQDLFAMSPEERAQAGVFLAFQYPMEIPGVASLTFLRAAMNAHRKARGEAEISIPDFMRAVKTEAEKLGISMEMLKRPLNVGFSGGEKKRNEVLQMALLKPTLCLLDEMDSGLDIDAIRVAAEGVKRLRSPDTAMIVITHYQRLLNYIVPDVVHVMARGQVLRSGGKELALELEESGYASYGAEAA